MSGVQINNNGKWSVKFDTYNGPVGKEYLASSVTTGAVFDSEDEAIAGAHRALDVLETTNKFPNLCAKF
jgi:hypothetical protein